VLNVLTWQGQVATPSDMDAMVSDQIAWLRAGAAAGLNVGALELGNEFYLPTTPGTYRNTSSASTGGRTTRIR